MSYAAGPCFTIEIDPTLPVATVVVKDAPTADDALRMGEAFVKYAQSINMRPWAMLSDLRNMSVATRDGQEQWVANMVQLMGLGLSRWAVLNRQANAALQATVVAKSSQIQNITVVTFDEAEAKAWAASVSTLVQR